MIMPTGTIMLYKYPGPHQIHGGMFDYIIVDEVQEEIDAAKAQGWGLTTQEAYDIHLAGGTVQPGDDVTIDNEKPPIINHDEFV